MYKFERSRVEDAKIIVTNMEDDILKEMRQLRNQSVEESIAQSIYQSDESWTVSDERGVICIFGVLRVSLLSDKARPWLISSKLVSSCKRDFLRGAKIVIERWLDEYTVLENHIPAGLHRLLRWVEWAGFTVYPATPIEGSGTLLHRIEMKK